jgi:hypothetical protein
MKKLCIIFFLSVMVNMVVSAQEYKKFKVGLFYGLTLSGTNGNGTTAGFSGTIEAVYLLSDKLAIGFRDEVAITEIAYGPYFIGVASLSVLSQYYLSTHRFRPFVGAGFGIYSSEDYYDESGKVSPFGFYPRVGFDVGHFSMSMDYNLILLPKALRQQDIKNNYLNIRLGVFIGGGKKKPSTVYYNYSAS